MTTTSDNESSKDSQTVTSNSDAHVASVWAKHITTTALADHFAAWVRTPTGWKGFHKTALLSETALRFKHTVLRWAVVEKAYRDYEVSLQAEKLTKRNKEVFTMLLIDRIAAAVQADLPGGEDESK